MPSKTANVTDKLLIDANQLLLESFRLARMIWDDGYRPDYIIGIWRGGTPVGVAVHEFFLYKGHDPYHTAIKTQSYIGFEPGNEVDVKGLEHIVDVVESEQNLLLVDDVFDTGRTISRVIKSIQRMARKNCPSIKVAAVYYKPTKNTTDIIPDYALRTTERWIVFPHELEDLTKDEIYAKGKDLADILFN